MNPAFPNPARTTDTTRTPGPVVLVAGGTGGHVFPAEALAHELSRRGIAQALITDGRGTAWAGTIPGLAIHAVRAGRITGVRPLSRLRGLADMLLGGLEARRLLRRLAPSAVIGFGGYTSLAPMLAAISLKLPTALHEQNALMGRANRLLAGRVRAVATSFARVARMPRKRAGRVHHTGNPVRPAIRELRSRPYPAPGPGEVLHILITGGSQGASVFSRILPEALGLMDDAARHRLRLCQQCRIEDRDAVETAYRRLGIEAEIAPFFADLPTRLGQAQLVICRAGASSIAELACAGRPAILVPYPHAADDHQTANARAVAETGGAIVMAEPDFTPEALARTLASFLKDPHSLARMALAMAGNGHPDADTALADLVMALALDARPSAGGIAA